MMQRRVPRYNGGSASRLHARLAPMFTCIEQGGGVAATGNRGRTESGLDERRTLLPGGDRDACVGRRHPRSKSWGSVAATERRRRTEDRSKIETSMCH